MRQGTAIFAAALCAVVAAKAAIAGPITDKAGEAESLAAKGDSLGALDVLDAAVDEVWTGMPLTIRKTLLVDSADGYGIYTPRADAVYRSGDKIRIYAEPAGYGYGRDKLGEIEIAFDVDLVLTDENDAEVLSQKNFLGVAMSSRYRNREFQVTMTLETAGAPPGRYTGAFVLRDRHSEKTASFSIPFEIAP